MPIRITGMNSGLDTDLIIKELMRGHRTKADNIKRNQVSLQWKQDAWKDLNTKALKLFNGTLSKMRFSDAYSKKTSKVSNTKASVITGEGAVNGTQKLTIGKLATTGYLTGADLRSNVSGVNGNTTLSQLGFTDEGSFTVKVGSAERQININGDTKIQDVVNQLKNVGLNANFDTANGRFFISSPTMGSAGDFSLTANNENGFNALTALGINYLDPDPEAVSPYQWLADLKDDTDNTIYTALVDAEATKLLKADEASRKVESDALTALTSKMKSKLQAYVDWLVDNGYAEEDEFDLESLDNVNLFDKEYVEGIFERVRKEEGGDELIEQLGYTEEIYDNDLAEVDRLEKSIDVWNGIIDETQYNEVAEANIDALIDLAIDAVEGRLVGSTGATRIKGEDAEITLNGATFTSSTNTFNINGLTITANQVTDVGEEITITTEDDTEGIYNMVKDFIKEYNILINEMDRLYNAASAKDYKPLTDEEKDAMSDREIEDWESKIKDSLLRRDSALLNISGAMKSAMSGAVSVGGKNMYLSDFGIEAVSYFLSAANEKNALYIDGDEDHPQNSGGTNKLMEAIARDPKAVTDFFTGLSRNLYGAMNTILLERNGEFKSAMTIYNDKQLQRDYDNLTKTLARQEEKLIRIEDKYYKQYTAMEVALAKMQSSQNALLSMMGVPQR